MLIGVQIKKNNRIWSQFPFENLRQPWHLSHFNNLFSETTAPMILKFHMQHDKAAGLH